jgi:hypothetical protein
VTNAERGGLMSGRKLLLITVGGCRCACRWLELVMWAYAQDVVLHHENVHHVVV